jgi:uncharacterized protein YecT (DUF1311 family)/DNA-binding beta-propeller fold protein YncE
MKVLNRLFIALAAIGLATMLVPLSATDVGLGARRGMAFDRSGNLFVSEDDTILKFTPDGHRSTFASGLIDPFGLAFDSAGNLFVSDMQSDRKSGLILKFSPDGKKTTFASGLPQPSGLAFDSAGNLFVVDMSGGAILKFAPDGTRRAFFTAVTTKFGSDRLVGSAGPAIDKVGNLFVSDVSSGSGTILKFTPDGTRSTFASGLGTPQVLVFDPSGNLYVSSLVAEMSGVNTQILKFAPDGSESTFAKGLEPVGLAFDGTGNFFAFDARSRSILKFTPDGTRSTFASDVSSTSPDKKWEFVGGEEPRILEAGTNQVVLEISEGRGVVVWAPDSKRFGFNYYGHGRRGYSFELVAFYELRGDKWVELHSPADDVREGSELVGPLKEHLPKKFNPRDCDPERDVLNFREWTDTSTAILYAPCYGRKSGKLKAAFLFTLKFDEAGNSKIVKTHQMSKKEIEKEDAGEDVSGPAQATDQEELSADASFRDADRHLNEVYNALRARLSPSERDGLKKEQLAWIDRRNAAGQLAKGNAQGNTTDAADREVTKMTLARAAELEKRLKKAK